MIPERRFLRSLASDRSGNIAIMFGIGLSLLVPAVGVAIDYGRAASLHTALQQSLDAAGQTTAMEINTCLEDDGRVSGQDRTCMNDPAFAGRIRDSLQTKLEQNFHQRGYSEAPRVIGAINIDKKTGDLSAQARVGYNCVFMHLITRNCSVDAGAGTDLTSAFAQSDTLILDGPTDVEIWSGEGHSLPVILTAEGGWKPYMFGVGPGLPRGLSFNASSTDPSNETAQISGIPEPMTSCNTVNCDPQTIGPIAFSVSDSGDGNRGGINKQTVMHNVRFKYIHPLSLTLTGTTAIQPGRYIYNITSNRKGGKPNPAWPTGYKYSCAGMPAGVGTNPMVCNEDTGEISGQPQPWSRGTITVTVTDGRGRTAQASISYDFTPPPITAWADRYSVSGYAEQDYSIGIHASGGWGSIRVDCTGAPAGVSGCTGTGTDSRFDGQWSGRPSNAGSGATTITFSDQAGQTATITITHNFTRPPNNRFLCGSNTVIGKASFVYMSVHCKWGCGNTQTKTITCGSNASVSEPGYTIMGDVFIGEGYALRKSNITEAELDGLIDRAKNLPDEAWYSDAGRAGTYYQDHEYIRKSEMNGDYIPSTSPPAPPSRCIIYGNDNGWSGHGRTTICY
ncbi:pilus assembly protein TadG-related protein [Microvirga tunisiensis]|nr:pilus assembly protein TadG-related protein [Microvirga tunisiensis]